MIRSRHGTRAARAIAFTAFVVLLWACADEHPTAPDRLDPSAAVQSRGDVGSQLEGCAVASLSVTGRDGVEAVVSDAGCGPLVVVLESASHDRVAGEVVLELRVENTGGTPAAEPVLLASWEDSLVVARPQGLARNPDVGTYLTLGGQDSIAPSTDEHWPDARIWRLEEAEAGDPPAGAAADVPTYGPARVVIGVHDGVLAFDVGLRVAARPVSTVPAQVPDELPADFLSELDPERGIPLNYVLVMFRQDTDVAEKARVIGLIDGVVTGGAPTAEGSLLPGWYVVRIEHDGTLRPGLEAVELLYDQPSVLMATMRVPVHPLWRRPNDDGDWSEWQVDPDSADGVNWAQELVAGPLAWGCSVGDEATPVALVDAGVHRVDDLNGYTITGATIDTTDHGTGTASVLAARGGNGDQMTGMMWAADLRAMQFDTTLGHADIPEQVETAIRNGARVVNMSVGHSIPGPTPTFYDSIIALRAGLNLVRTLNTVVAEGHELPLLVIGAGNNGLLVDAALSGFPIAVEHYPDNVLVVAGTADGRPTFGTIMGIWTGSSVGDLPEIAAPAQNVGTLDRKGEVVPRTGTSFAAPLVSGTAGLLLAFDPTIPNDTLKHLILEGADSGGVSTIAYPYPVLNAYEALKAAARRPGAPVCGNAVAAERTELLVHRSSGWEKIGDVGGNWGDINVPHGGATIDAWTWHRELGTTYDRRLTWSPDAGWSHTGTAPTRGGLMYDGAFYNSMRSTAHDPDTAVTIRRTGGWHLPEYYITISPPGRWYDPWRTIDVVIPSFDIETSAQCVNKTETDDWYYCHHAVTFYNGDRIDPRVAWHPQGGRVIVWVRRATRTETLGAWYACGREYQSCRDQVQNDRWHTTEIYEIDLTQDQPELRHLWDLDYAANQLGVSEDGKEIVVVRTKEEWDWTLFWVTRENRWGNLQAFSDSNGDLIVDACTVETYRYSDGQRLVEGFPERVCVESHDFDYSILEYPLLGHGS